MTPRPLLLLEINEIPWRLLDRFKHEDRFSNLRRFLEGASSYTTLAVDTGELSPWVTWPSFHRGMSNVEHGIKDLGQDVRTFKGTPIWEEYRKRGYAIGVCGSLQSWPPIDPGPDGFYIPDTFSHDERCVPRYLEPLQRFNLKQVRAQGRTVNHAIAGLRDLPELLLTLPRLGIRPATMKKVAMQLFEERIDPKKVARRPVFQGLVFWDVFKALYNPSRPPMFASFFTNHVASLMHRYWDHAFPEDFGARAEDKPHIDTLRFGLEVLDAILADVAAFQSQNRDLITVFATSMGQGPVRRTHHEGYEMWIRELDRFLSALGVPASAYTVLLAMVPQVAADIPDADLRRRLKNLIEEATTESGKRPFTLREDGTSLNITFSTPRKADIDAGGFFFSALDGGARRSVTWDEAGFQVSRVEPGTGYHVPEGVMAVAGSGIPASDSRTKMRASEVKAFLMELTGLVDPQVRSPGPQSTFDARA